MVTEKNQQFLKKCEDYIGNLTKGGKLKSAQPLVREGKIISGSKGTWKDVPSNAQEHKSFKNCDGVIPRRLECLISCKVLCSSLGIPSEGCFYYKRPFFLLRFRCNIHKRQGFTGCYVMREHIAEARLHNLGCALR
jgi:hypothetical protein